MKAKYQHYCIVSDGNCHIGQFLLPWSKTFIAVWKGQILKYSTQYTYSLANCSGESRTCALPETRGYNGGSKKIQLAPSKSQFFSTKTRMMVTVKPLLAFWQPPHIFLKNLRNPKPTIASVNTFKLDNITNTIRTDCVVNLLVYICLDSYPNSVLLLYIWKILAKEHDRHLVEVQCCLFP